jgi:D-beta-D-heptose 7-phosphate kinase/D-beta-D-heptose 1-phosphate adenosyltransferase
MSPLHVTVMGDALLDCDIDGVAERLCPDAPAPVVTDAATSLRPGGAGLAAVLLRRMGIDVTLVTALARDSQSDELATALRGEGVEVVAAARRRRTIVKTRIRAGGHVLARVDVDDDGELHVDTRAARRLDERLGRTDGILVADYGAGVTALDPVRAFLGHAAAARPVVWDPHPAGTEPVPGTRIATPNRVEAARGQSVRGIDDAVDAAFRLRDRWGVPMVVVTLGERGAVLVGAGDQPFVVPPAFPADGDACGAGDCFSARLTAALADGAIATEAVIAAVRDATAFVAQGGVAALRRRPEPSTADDPFARARHVRRAGGTVVATSGCFDLLHAGHVASLEAARALGDLLVVCLNSDASVRRLKGPGRPLVDAADRQRVLESLACVDAVVCFDDETPARVLEQLRPHVFVKGGDYGGAPLPEEAVLRQWGGRAVIVPYLDGRSTSSIVQEVQRGE